MLHNLKNRKKSEGFTIIEVLIVLAIAGLILLVVFLAVPALQRNSRNTQRKSDVSHLLGLINEYTANNSGTVPTVIVNSAAPASNPGATTLYLGNEKFSILTMPPTSVSATAPTATPAIDTILIVTSASCNGNAVVTGASSRSFVAYYAVEGSSSPTPICSQG